MRRTYTFFLYFALPFIFLRLLWRARRNPAYAKRWQERLGCIPQTLSQNSIWIHAVSVGETLAAIPLVKALQKKFPQSPILITTMTPTGSDRVRATFGDSVEHCYLPYDLPLTLKCFLNKVKPKLLIIIETELWPNLLRQCRLHQIPIILANARLSEKSANGYQRIAPIARQMLQDINLLAVQTTAEADRFIALGAKPEQINVTGSIRFDLEIPEQLHAQAQTLRDQWGRNRNIWIAASTHEGEEEKILAAFAIVQKTLPQTLLVLVPRHPERFAKVNQLCQQQGYETVLRSSQQACKDNSAIFIGDTMGELLLFYAAADIAFVGGSLIERGGHNPLEPAALGLPVIMGPHVFNFVAICAELKKCGALIEINTAEQLAEIVLQLLQNKSQREKMGAIGQHFVQQNRGALDKHVRLIEGLMSYNFPSQREIN
jgi:3-deoxy-D-manno-octulosonic-acid transferase